ncbi:uncharacterized protein PG986_004261 [Apiospora aurea]|uniref:Uncharacterized protein n=1 Tax=Apiospora aurea TaxID=335848 RepID=A0ABR1QM33_9PEZI
MAASGQVVEIGTNYILPVVQNLEKAGQPGAPILEIACGICLWRTLDISTKVGGLIEAECRLPPEEAAQSKDDFYEKHQLEYTIFLKCGHLVGATCWEAQMERPDFSAQQCNFCKASLLCDGCPSRILMDDRPGVGLTAVEIDPDALRFCGPCARYQVRRKFADMLLTFPRCHADECFPPGPDGGQQQLPPPPPPGMPHEQWRQANVAQWVRQKVGEISYLVVPRTNDVRDPQRRAEIEAEFDATRRTVQQSLSTFAPRVQAARQLAFRPCRDPGNGRNGAGTRVVTAQQVSENLALAEAHLSQFYDRAIDRLPAVWYRGGGVPLQRHPPEYQVEAPPGLSEAKRRAVRYLLMTVGADSVDEAEALIHPSVIAGSSMNEIIGRAQTIVVLRPDEFE